MRFLKARPPKKRRVRREERGRDDIRGAEGGKRGRSTDRERCVNGRKTYGVPLVARGAHDGGEGGSVGGPSREFIEDVTQGPGEDALDSSHLFERINQCEQGAGGSSLSPIAQARGRSHAHLITGRDEILERGDDGQAGADGRLVQELGAALAARGYDLLVQHLRT